MSLNFTQIELSIGNKKQIICDNVVEKLKHIGCATCHICWSEGLFDRPSYYVVLRGLNGWQRYRKMIQLHNDTETIIANIVDSVLLERI